MAAEDHATQYEIRIRGRLAPRWAAWFDGLRVTAEADGTTAIRGPVTDQAALHGLLGRVRDIGVPLVSVAELPPDESNEPVRLPEQEGN